MLFFIEPELSELNCQLRSNNVVLDCVSALDSTQVMPSYLCSYDGGTAEPCESFS